MSDLLGRHFMPITVEMTFFGKTPFWTSEVCRRWQERAKNLRIRFYRLVGRVRTLRVPARRLGALTRGASLDVRKVPHGDHFGIKN